MAGIVVNLAWVPEHIDKPGEGVIETAGVTVPLTAIVIFPVVAVDVVTQVKAVVITTQTESLLANPVEE